MNLLTAQQRLPLRPCGGLANGCAVASGKKPYRGAGFTMIELILVMTILTVALSITAPALANFFRGRSMDYEARRLLALVRHGQSRAVSEGVPIELWINVNEGTFGLEAEPSYETVDSKALEFTLDKDLKLELPLNTQGSGLTGSASAAPEVTTPTPASMTSAPIIQSRHLQLPRIRFLPDGTIADSSPQLIRVTGRDGTTLWLTQTRNRLTYEIRAPGN